MCEYCNDTGLIKIDNLDTVPCNKCSIYRNKINDIPVIHVRCVEECKSCGCSGVCNET